MNQRIMNLGFTEQYSVQHDGLHHLKEDGFDDIKHRKEIVFQTGKFLQF